MKNIRIFGYIIATLILETTSLLLPNLAQAANLTSAKDTLQSSRMSFSGRVKTPTVAGSSHVWIHNTVSGSATSVSTAGLKPGDSLTIGTTNGYIIASIIDNDEFTITTTLNSGDDDDGDPIYFKAKPMHLVTFNTASAISGGFFRILIPAAAAGSNDTIPDITGFDFNGGVSATASSRTNYTFLTSDATKSGDPGCTSPANYHCFEFHYGGTGGVGTGLQFFIGLSSGSNTMVAPAPSAGRIADTADTYTFKIQNFSDGSDPESATPTDDVQGRISVIESIRVSATVDPSITFKIEGVSSSTSTCSLTTNVTTTATSVPFGVLTLDTFRVGSQKITVSTNAAGGYSVTAIENERLSNLAGTASYIPNTLCDSGTCTYSGVGSTWATAASHPGFGYTVAIESGSPTIIPIAAAYRPFASAAANEPPTQIMSNPTIASAQAAYVCYKISVDATQAAGNYENQVTYTATSTF